MSLESEIRAYSRRRKRVQQSDNSFWSITFGIAMAIVIAVGLAEAYRSHTHDVQLQQRAAEQAARDAETAMQQARLEARRAAARQAAVTTASGRSYYAPLPPPEPAVREKSNVERYDEALAWMESSRRTQRRIDDQQYSRNGAHQVINDGGYKSRRCRQIDEARENIHEAMRRPYGNQLGEWYRGQLRDNHNARIAARC